MAIIDDGGAAFPVLPPIDLDGATPSGYPFPHDGMSLRDWFAGKALAGILADHTIDLPAAECAKTAYRLADEMIAARKAESES